MTSLAIIMIRKKKEKKKQGTTWTPVRWRLSFLRKKPGKPETEKSVLGQHFQCWLNKLIIGLLPTGPITMLVAKVVLRCFYNDLIVAIALWNEQLTVANSAEWTKTADNDDT